MTVSYAFTKFTYYCHRRWTHLDCANNYVNQSRYVRIQLETPPGQYIVHCQARLVLNRRRSRYAESSRIACIYNMCLWSCVVLRTAKRVYHERNLIYREHAKSKYWKYSDMHQTAQVIRRSSKLLHSHLIL